jgi:hypothetical protein
VQATMIDHCRPPRSGAGGTRGHGLVSGHALPPAWRRLPSKGRQGTNSPTAAMDSSTASPRARRR